MIHVALNLFVNDSRFHPLLTSVDPCYCTDSIRDTHYMSKVESTRSLEDAQTASFTTLCDNDFNC